MDHSRERNSIALLVQSLARAVRDFVSADSQEEDSDSDYVIDLNDNNEERTEQPGQRVRNFIARTRLRLFYPGVAHVQEAGSGGSGADSSALSADGEVHQRRRRRGVTQRLLHPRVRSLPSRRPSEESGLTQRPESGSSSDCLLYTSPSPRDRG